MTTSTTTRRTPWITMTYIDGELAGTTRVNCARDEAAILPCFQRLSRCHCAAVCTRAHRLIEITRLAARLDLAGAFPELAYVTVRPAYLAAEHFDADFAVATPRPSIWPFSPRVSLRALVRAPRLSRLFRQVRLHGHGFSCRPGRIEARYPFFRSTPAEREALFGPRDADVRAARPHAAPTGAFRVSRQRVTSTTANARGSERLTS